MCNNFFITLSCFYRDLYISISRSRLRDQDSELPFTQYVLPKGNILMLSQQDL